MSRQEITTQEEHPIHHSPCYIFTARQHSLLCRALY